MYTYTHTCTRIHIHIHVPIWTPAALFGSLFVQFLKPGDVFWGALVPCVFMCILISLYVFLCIFVYLYVYLCVYFTYLCIFCLNNYCQAAVYMK